MGMKTYPYDKQTPPAVGCLLYCEWVTNGLLRQVSSAEEGQAEVCLCKVSPQIPPLGHVARNTLQNKSELTVIKMTVSFFPPWDTLLSDLGCLGLYIC